jgi:acetyl esterase/lipase
MSKWKRWLIASLLCCTAAWAQQPAPPLPAELFFKPPEIIDAKLSPSGRWLAVRSTLAGERVGLFIWDLEGGGDAQRAASGGGSPRVAPAKVNRAAQFTDIDIGRFHWVGDERLVFDLIDLSEGSAQQLAPGLYTVQRDGEGVRELVARRGRPFISGPKLGRESLGPLHRLLTVPANAVDEVIVGEMVVAGGELVAVNPLWLSLTSGRTRNAVSGAPSAATGWLFDSRGEARVAVVHSRGRRQLHWRGPGEDGWRQISDEDALLPRFSPSFVDDSGNLYVTRAEGPAGLRVLARFDFATGAPQPTPLVSVKGFDYAGAPVLGRNAAGATLLGLHVEADSQVSIWFDERMKQVQQLADQRLPNHVNRLSCRRCGEDDMLVLVHAFSDRDPGHLWLYRSQPAAGADGKPQPAWQIFSRLRLGVDPARMAGVAFQRIAARDGREIPLWVTLPPGRKAGDKGPAVVLVHGGPWVRGGHWRWSAMEQFLASRGYLVIAPDFRGSTGYGAEHFKAGFRQWGRAMQDDVADAARWAIGQGLADRFCIAGASYGGYSTLMGLVRDPELYRCGVAWVAVTDPFLYLEGSWWIDDDISSDGRRYTLPRMVGDAEKDAAMLKAASPLEQAARIRAPLLLAWGERDRRVPIAHGERLQRALREAGNTPLWVSYADEGHSWLKLATHVDFARRIEAFFDEHLKPAATAPR